LQAHCPAGHGPHTGCAAWSYVTLVERYPVLQGHGMCRVLAIGTLLAHLPEAERATRVATLTGCSLPELWARARTLPRLPVLPPYIVVADQQSMDTAKTPSIYYCGGGQIANQRTTAWR
jgi:hypothetical protein